MNGMYYPSVIDRPCQCDNWNFYRFPKPIRRVQRLLDTTKIEIHTDEFVGEDCFDMGACCEPVPVKVEKSIKSLIIHAETECLEPVTYYTLHINHPLPDGVFADPTFIRVKKCGAFKEPVKLIRTKTVFPFCHHDWCGIPSDPAFPENGVSLVGNEDGMIFSDGQDVDLVDGGVVEREDGRGRSRGHRHDRETRLIPVELDLHGDTAFGDSFVKGISPHPKTIQLFYTNRGTFSLCRTFKRRTDF